MIHDKPDMPELEEKYHSESVQEIMGSVPSWTTRWGASVIAVIFAVLIAGCYIIKYPQTVESSVILTSENPPSDLVSRYDGLLDTLCVKNEQKVKEGDIVALLATPAAYDRVSTAVFKRAVGPLPVHAANKPAAAIITNPNFFICFNY